ncbi:MAG: hypothetical protein WD690_17515 [Vicinamibacterales bacterium]
MSTVARQKGVRAKVDLAPGLQFRVDSRREIRILFRASIDGSNGVNC